MSLTFPELPDGYRWKYHLDYTLREPILKIQKRHWWGWWATDSTWVINTLSEAAEQASIDKVCQYLLSRLEKRFKTESGSFGTYYGGTKDENT